MEEIRGYVENKMFPRAMRWQQAEVIIPKSVTLEEANNKLGLHGSRLVAYVMRSKIPARYLANRFAYQQGKEIYVVEGSDPASWEDK